MSRQQKRKVQRDEKKAASRKKAPAATAVSEEMQVREHDEQRPKGLSRIEARSMLRAAGITEPVRFEQSPVENDRIKIEDIADKGDGVFTCARRARKTGRVVGRSVVQYDPENNKWSCSCPKWRAKRSRDCDCMHAVKTRLGVATVPYVNARRRPPTYYIFEDGAESESTVRKHARLEMATRIPLFIEEICAYHIPDAECHHSGATGIPMRVLAYAMMTKVLFNLSLEDLVARLATDAAIYRLGWAKPQPPSDRALSRRFGAHGETNGGHERGNLADVLFRLISVSAFPGRRLDRTLLGDSHDIPCVRVANSRDMKYAERSNLRTIPYRSKKPLVRQHFGVGDISSLIYAVNVTMSQGLGAGDNAHLPSIAVLTAAIAPEIRRQAWDRAYSSHRNFRVAEEMGFDLYVREKGNEKRLNGNWGKVAERLAIMDAQNPEEYDDVGDMRSKGEGTPNRLKWRNPMVRCRRRKRDPVVQFPEGIEDEKLSEQPEEVISAVLEAATRNVGYARLAEAYAIIVVANLRQIVMLEHLHRDRMTFAVQRDFNPIRIVRDVEVLPKAS